MPHSLQRATLRVDLVPQKKEVHRWDNVPSARLRVRVHGPRGRAGHQGRSTSPDTKPERGSSVSETQRRRWLMGSVSNAGYVGYRAGGARSAVRN